MWNAWNVQSVRQNVVTYLQGVYSVVRVVHDRKHMERQIETPSAFGASLVPDREKICPGFGSGQMVAAQLFRRRSKISRLQVDSALDADRVVIFCEPFRRSVHGRAREQVSGICGPVHLALTSANSRITSSASIRCMNMPCRRPSFCLIDQLA